MKYAIMLSALLALVAIGCKKESGDAKKETPATKTGDPQASDAGKAEPAMADAAAGATKAGPLTDEQCQELVGAVLGCVTSGESATDVSFDYEAWEADPAAVCKSWRALRPPEPFPSGAAIYAAVDSGDCGDLKTALDAAGGIPAPPEEAKPLSDDECKAVVKEIATCGTGKTASEEFRSWIGMALFIDEQSASGSKQLDKELASWKKDPDRVCNIFKETSEDEPMFGGHEAPIRNAVTKHDCAALREAAEDLPWPQEGE